MVSLVLGTDGLVEKISAAEFQNFIDDDGWSTEKHEDGWAFWRDETSSSFSSSENFKCLLRKIVKSSWSSSWSCLVQFWAPTAVGGKCYLKTSDQPFAISRFFSEGLYWYRKYCMDSGLKIYVGDGAKEEQLGPIGRVFRNQLPESSPDLRLYYAAEHPLRDQAADCGVRGYVALPVFYLDLNQCLGVLEVVSYSDCYIEQLAEALKEANLHSTHIDFGRPMKNPKYQSEFRKMLDTAIVAVPQLHLAQVWVPCKECSNKGNNLSCMETAAFISAADESINSYGFVDNVTYAFLEAIEFHKVQSQKGVAGIVLSSTNKSCFCRNISDLRITEYPLAHYARRARLSFCFAIYLQSVHSRSEFCILEFFLQCPQSRKDLSAQSVLHLLFQIINEELPSYTIASGQQLPQELVVKVGTKNKQLVSCGFSFPITSPNMIISTMIGYDKSDAIFKCTLDLDDLCSDYIIYWEIMDLLEKLLSIFESDGYNMVQFWALKSCYLKTLDQPYTVLFDDLDQKYLFYREQCMKHEYFVGEGAKEEEIGPPGRVFRNRLPEFTPDLRLYSTREFPLRDTAVHCGFRKYLALPVFDIHHKHCIGALEFIGLGSDNFWDPVCQPLTNSREGKISLKSTHIYHTSRPLQSVNEVTALTEIKRMLEVVSKASELCLTQVWVPCSQCDAIDNNLSCLEQASSLTSCHDVPEEWKIFEFCKVEIGKGIAGTVLAAENKSCLIPSLCDFSIAEEPRARYAERHRLNVCFVVCLQSEYTDNNQYIVEFFLDPSCRNYEIFCPFLHFLLSIMKEELKSFKFASGNQIGDELVIEVINFGEDSELFTPFESHQPVDKFPFRFNTISYGKKMEHQVVCHASEEIEHQVRQEMVHHQVGQETENQHAFEEREHQGAQEIKQQVDSGRNALEAREEIKKERNKTSFNISLKDLQPHFGRSTIDEVIKVFPVSRSTFKRIIRSHGIPRWPSNTKNKKNPSIFEESNANKRVRGNRGETLVSSSNIPPCLDQKVLLNTDILIGSSQNHIDLPKSDDVVTIKNQKNSHEEVMEEEKSAVENMLKKKVEGVTKLISHIISPDNHAYEIKKATMPQPTPECKRESKSTPTPLPSSAHNSEIVELLKALSNYNLLNKKFDFELGELSRKVDFVVDEVGELNRKVDFLVDELMGESRKEGALKKIKINNKKMEPPQNILMTISEEKKRSFYDWYNGNDESKMAKCFNGEYTRAFFAKILNVAAWFEDSHLQEGLSLIRSKQKLFPQLYDPDCVILDAYFGQVLDGEAQRLLKLKHSNVEAKPNKKAEQVNYEEEMSMEDVEKLLLGSRYNDAFDEYFQGKRPSNIQDWRRREVQKVYGILNILNIHWITIVWLLEEGKIEILDCNKKCYRKEKLDELMWAPSVLFPKLLKASCQFSRLKQDIFDRKWTYDFVKNLPSNSSGGDCGIYALKFVEFHMTKTPLDDLNDTKIKYFREALAIEIFEKEVTCEK